MLTYLAAKLAAIAGPPEDSFDHRQTFAGPNTSASMWIAATDDPTDPQPNGITLHNTVWYEFTSLLTGPSEFSIHGTQRKAGMAIYRGSALTNLVLLGFVRDNPDAELARIDLVEGQKYIVLMGMLQAGSSVAANWFITQVRPDLPKVAIAPGPGAQISVSVSYPFDRFVWLQMSYDLRNWQTVALGTNGEAIYRFDPPGPTAYFRGSLAP